MAGGRRSTFGADGRTRWNIRPRANIWTVAGIDANGGRPGLVIYSDGETVFVLDSKGGNVGTIARGGQGIMPVAASEMDAAGERQVVAVWPAVVGTVDYAIATDLKGKVLWKFPVDSDAMRDIGPTIIAADVTGDGTKEWIISPNSVELVVLDTRPTPRPYRGHRQTVGGLDRDQAQGQARFDRHRGHRQNVRLHLVPQALRASRRSRSRSSLCHLIRPVRMNSFGRD